MGYIKITSIDFTPVNTINIVVNRRYKLSSAADSTYSTPATLSVWTGGVLPTPHIISNLLNYTSYRVRFTSSCGSYERDFVTSIEPTTTTTTTLPITTTTTTVPITTTTTTVPITTTTTTDPDATTTTTTLGPTTTTTTTMVPLIAYWGFKSGSETLTQTQIASSSNSQSILINQDIICSFTDGFGTPSYLWMAEPLACPVKTKWQDVFQVANGGNIGTADDLFGSSIVSGGFRFYITEYPTEQSNPIKFKVT